MQNGESTPVNHLHVVRCMSKGLSEDGTQGVIAFETADGEPFFLRISVAELRKLRVAVQQLDNEHAHKRSSYTFATPNSFGIVDAPQRNHQLLAMAPESHDESVFLIPDKMAIEMAKQLMARAMGHMTPEQRAQQASGSRLILPGGRT